MNSGRITLGFLLIVIISVGFFFSVAKMPSAYAATSMNQTTSAQVIVNGFVSVTLFNVPIYFSGTDPGTNNSAANATGGFPMIVQVDPITNAFIWAYLNASNFTSGTNGFTTANMSFNVTRSATAFANSSCNISGVAPCNYSLTPVFVFNETARMGAGANSSVYNWISIPTAQAPGTYTNLVRICVNQVYGAC
jgi:hypothetical protein